MFEFPVPMSDNSTYLVKQLLAKGESNWKIAKSNKTQKVYVTKSLSFAPHKASGFNVCASASHACITDCLYTAGFAQIHPRTIQPARIAKTRFFKLYPSEFRSRLEKELTDSVRTIERKGAILAIRLNVLSDVIWEKECPGIFDAFPTVQFYDYTKHYLRMIRYLNGELPPNLHLTFSWSGTNKDKCIDIISRKGNVAVPFHVPKGTKLPETFLGYPVVNGDETDLRFLDPSPSHIIGLKAKGKARADHSTGFVVNPNGLEVA